MSEAPAKAPPGGKTKLAPKAPPKKAPAKKMPGTQPQPSSSSAADAAAAAAAASAAAKEEEEKRQREEEERRAKEAARKARAEEEAAAVAAEELAFIEQQGEIADYIIPGMKLFAGHKITSPSGEYTLLHQQQQDETTTTTTSYQLVLMQNDTEQSWAPALSEPPAPSEDVSLLPATTGAFLQLTSEGDLQLVTRDGATVLWASGATGAASLYVQDDGYVCMYSEAGDCVWYEPTQDAELEQEQEQPAEEEEATAAAAAAGGGEEETQQQQQEAAQEEEEAPLAQEEKEQEEAAAQPEAAAEEQTTAPAQEEPQEQQQEQQGTFLTSTEEEEEETTAAEPQQEQEQEQPETTAGDEEQEPPLPEQQQEEQVPQEEEVETAQQQEYEEQQEQPPAAEEGQEEQQQQDEQGQEEQAQETTAAEATATATTEEEKPVATVIQKPLLAAVKMPPSETVQQAFELSNPSQQLDSNGTATTTIPVDELPGAVELLWPGLDHPEALQHAVAHAFTRTVADGEATATSVSRRDFDFFVEYIVLFNNTRLKLLGKCPDETTTEGADFSLTEEEFVAVALAESLLDGEGSDEQARSFFQQQQEATSAEAKGAGVTALSKAVADELVSAHAAATNTINDAIQRSANSDRTQAGAFNSTDDNGAATSSSSQMGGTQRGKPRKLPVIDTALAIPKKVPKKPETPEELRLPYLDKPRRKVRVEGDPVVDALEEKVRERRAAERARREAMMEKAREMQEQFEKNEAERQKAAHERKMDELRAKREEAALREELRREAESQRVRRLNGKVKVDIEVITGKKPVDQAMRERFEKQQEAEREAEQRMLEERKNVYKMGKDFYKNLDDHALRCKEIDEQLEKERRERSKKQMVPQPPTIPKDLISKAHERVKKENETEKQARDSRLSELQQARQRQRHFVEDVRKNKKPKQGDPFAATMEKDKDNVTSPRNALTPADRNAAGNDNIRSPRKGNSNNIQASGDGDGDAIPALNPSPQPKKSKKGKK